MIIIRSMTHIIFFHEYPIYSYYTECSCSSFLCFGFFLFDCRVYCLMKASASCIKVFRDGRISDMESMELKPMRDEAWELMLSRQRTIFPFCFQVLWSIWLVVVFGACIGINIYDMILGKNFILAAVACGFNGGAVIMWITFTAINFMRYRPDGDEVKGGGRVVSYFYMEQIQQFLSELSVYPQLCISCMLLLTTYNTPRVLSFFLCLVSLTLLSVIRLCTVIKIRGYLRVLFLRSVLFIIGSCLVTYLWLTALSAYSWPQGFHAYNIAGEILPRVVLCVFIFCNNTLNMVMFYISHLYEVILQCGFNIMKLNPHRFDSINRVMTSLTKETPSFHKNMYAMSSTKYGTLLYFWMFPIAIVIITCYLCLIFSSSSTQEFSSTRWIAIASLFAAASIANFLINAKTFLLSCSGHFTLCVILALLYLCAMASAFFIFLIYATIIFFLALCIICACLASSRDDD